MAEISLLLGAGFSVNKGYPTANQLNQKLIELTAEQFAVAQQGSVCWLGAGQEDPYMHSSYYIQKLFTLELIAFYTQISGSFNYEEFFDYYINVNKAGYEDEAFTKLCEDFREKYHLEEDNVNLIRGHDSIFNQLVSAILVDGDGNKYYPKIQHGGAYQGYNGFLRCMQHWKKENIVYINTLNHDLFLESLNLTDAFSGVLSTGFEELGSPYFGEIDEYGMVRLSYFSAKFHTDVRLYKLHGSLDQYPFHSTIAGGVTDYIKIRKGVGITDFYKEVKGDDGMLKYENDFMNYFPDFLSGTTSKILRYKDPVYYERIFSLFEANLRSSSKLIIIGYGCADSEINNLISANFKGQVYLVDPFPQQQTHMFCEKTGAVLIIKTPEDLIIEDFGA